MTYDPHHLNMADADVFIYRTFFNNERDLGTNPTIGSVSFGATRSFQFQHKNRKELRATVDIGHGDFLVMRGTTQQGWRHQVPKTSRPVGPRINLTFRVVI